MLSVLHESHRSLFNFYISIDIHILSTITIIYASIKRNKSRIMASPSIYLEFYLCIPWKREQFAYFHLSNTGEASISRISIVICMLDGNSRRLFLFAFNGIKGGRNSMKLCAKLDDITEKHCS